MENLELELKQLKLKQLELDLELAEENEEEETIMLWIQYSICNVKVDIYENHPEHFLRSYYQERDITFVKWEIEMEKRDLANAKSENEKRIRREKIEILRKKLELKEKQYTEWKEERSKGVKNG